ncbi:hypothetical protein GH733_011718 [Mirounga leonina]|nr:hypothetical protein GH733_011718 [Mirounga leonina]
MLLLVLHGGGLVEALKPQKQLKIPTKSLSEGVKRKVGGGLHVTLRTPHVGARHAVLPFQLCLALSILRDPSVVILDELSTGVDPEG